MGGAVAVAVTAVARCSSGAGADATRGLRRCCTAGVFSSKGLAGDGLARRGPTGGATAVVTAIGSTAGSGQDAPKRQNVGCTAGVFSTKGSAGDGLRQKGSTGGACVKPRSVSGAGADSSRR